VRRFVLLKTGAQMPVFRDRADLLRRFRSGDPAALEEVYWAYVGKIEGIVRHGVAVPATGGRVGGPGRQRADLADLVQEIFIRAFTPSARQTYDGLREYGPYLFTVARNVVIDWARRNGREIPTLDVDLERLVEAPGPALAEETPAGELEIVRRYLDGLPPELQAVHQVRYEQGMSQRTAAERLGVTRQQLRTLEDHLRSGLRRALKRSELGKPAAG
jgi:RNA polymerase sigma-70 factor (ECF subfamily)